MSVSDILKSAVASAWALQDVDIKPFVDCATSIRSMLEESASSTIEAMRADWENGKLIIKVKATDKATGSSYVFTWKDGCSNPTTKPST